MKKETKQDLLPSILITFVAALVLIALYIVFAGPSFFTGALFGLVLCTFIHLIVNDKGRRVIRREKTQLFQYVNEVSLNKNMGYHCPTKTIARQFLDRLRDNGYVWIDGGDINEETYYSAYGHATHYYLMPNKKVGFGGFHVDIRINDIIELRAEPILKEGYGYWCPTQELFDEVLAQAHEMGLAYGYLSTDWELWGEQTCVLVALGCIHNYNLESVRLVYNVIGPDGNIMK